MEFVPIRRDEHDYADYVGLFSRCFPGVTKFDRRYLEWLYRRNPDGEVMGCDAWDGNKLVAHYACIPARANVDCQSVRVLLSLNTATHPAYQGRGLFTKLAERTYATAANQGYSFVYGVANANSTPGFVRKLGFQVIGSLRARVGVGELGIEFDHGGLQFCREWSQESLAWRCASPANPVGARVSARRTTFLAPAILGSVVQAVAEVDVAAPVGHRVASGSSLRLFIGTVPQSWQKRSLYADIPWRLRPSPLNLVYRSLLARNATIEMESSFVTFLDFDAY